MEEELDFSRLFHEAEPDSTDGAPGEASLGSWEEASTVRPASLLEEARWHLRSHLTVRVCRGLSSCFCEVCVVEMQMIELT